MQGNSNFGICVFVRICEYIIEHLLQPECVGEYQAIGHIGNDGTAKIISVFEHGFHLLALYVGRRYGKLLQFFERCRKQICNKFIYLIGFAHDLSIVCFVFFGCRNRKPDFGNCFNTCNRRFNIVR